MCNRVSVERMAKAKKESDSAVLDAACAPEWTDLLKQMIFIRRFEEATEREFRKGKIGGYLHVYIGQIRRKLAAADPEGALADLFVAEPGVGYRVRGDS